MLDVAPNVYGRDCRCDVGGMVPFGPLVVRQQKLLGWSQQRYSQMQALQGIGIFLNTPIIISLSYIIINHRECGVPTPSSPHPPPQLSALHCCYIQRFLYPCEQVAGSIHRTQCPSFVRPVVDWTHERRTSGPLTMRTLWNVLYSKVSLVGQ